MALREGDAAAANELAAEAGDAFPDFGKPTVDEVARQGKPVYEMEVPYLSGASRRLSDMSVDDILSGSYGEVQRRTERLTGGRAPTQIEAELVQASEMVRRGGEIAMQGLVAITPDVVKEGMAEAWAEARENPAVQTALQKATEGYQAYKDWSLDHPQAAEAFESIIDVSTIMAPKPRPSITGLADDAGKRSAKISYDQKRSAIDKVMDPLTTREAGYGGTWVANDDTLGTISYLPTDREVRVRDALATVDELDPTDNLVKMENVTSKAIEDQGKEVVAFINRAGNPRLPKLKEYFERRFADTSDAYGSLNLSEAAQRQVKKYIDMSLKIIDESDGTVMGLYEARKRFDKLVNEFESKDILEPEVASAKGVAASYVRGAINDVIKAATPGDNVAEAFDRMHNLYTARDHLRMRSQGLADNAIKRTWAKVHDGLNLPSTPLALAATIGGAASVAAMVGLTPAAIMSGAGAGLSVFAVAKMLSKKNRAKFYAQLLSATDKGIKRYSSDKNTLRELRADRAVILELLRQEQEEKAPSQ
jgi:hypothetical protein